MRKFETLDDLLEKATLDEARTMYQGACEALVKYRKGELSDPQRFDEASLIDNVDFYYNVFLSVREREALK